MIKKKMYIFTNGKTNIRIELPETWTKEQVVEYFEKTMHKGFKLKN